MSHYKILLLIVKIHHINMVNLIQQVDSSNNISASKLHLSKAVAFSHVRRPT